MNDNRGLSLIELLIAFAISAVVLAGVGYLIMTGLKMSGRNNAHVEVQNEAQTTMNLIIDNIMETQGVCVPFTEVDKNTECVLLGDLVIEEAGTGYSVYFKGNAVVSDIDSVDAEGKPLREMYLVSFPNNDFTEDSGKPGYCKLINNVSKRGANEAERKGAVAGDALEKVRHYVKEELKPEDRIKWLLARYITGFRVDVERIDSDYYEETVQYMNGEEEVFYYYADPITLNVAIELEYDYQSGQVQRTLEDSAAVRSRLNEVYVEKKNAADIKFYEFEREK